MSPTVVSFSVSRDKPFLQAKSSGEYREEAPII